MPVSEIVMWALVVCIQFVKGDFFLFWSVEETSVFFIEMGVAPWNETKTPSETAERLGREVVQDFFCNFLDKWY